MPFRAKSRGQDPAQPIDRASLPGPAVAAAAVAIAALLAARPAFAMHLAEGILPLPWAAVWWAAALPVLAFSTARLTRRSAQDPVYKPFVAMLGATVFVLSCMPVPVPFVGTCSHPCGTGLSAVLIGPAMTVVVAFVALLLQALFLAHGGLSTLGADLCSMGIAGGVAGFLAWKLCRRCGASSFASAFAAGLLSDWCTYATTAAQLSLGLHQDQPRARVFGAVLLAFLPTQLPLGILEGAVSACAVAFLLRRRPALLQLFAEPAR